MNKPLTFKIIPELRIIIEYAQGDLVINDFFALKKLEFKHPDFNPHFNYIVDVRNADVDISSEDLQQYVDYASCNPLLSNKRHSALLTDTPNQAATSMLYKLHLKKTPMNFEVVSTLKAALEWIQVSADHSDYIEQILLGLKQS